MENSLLSSDSLGSELDMLRQTLKQRDRELADKELIIGSLRERERDMNQAIEELENNEQLLRRTTERLTRELEEKNSELESVSHALKEVESAYETLNKRTEAKTAQLQQFVESLSKQSKELEESREQIKDLASQNERLNIQLSEINLTKKKSVRDYEQQIEQLSQQLAASKKTMQESESRLKLASAMRFSIMDEFGEVMESKSIPQSAQPLSQHQSQPTNPKTRTASERLRLHEPTSVGRIMDTSNSNNENFGLRAAASLDETKRADPNPTCVHRQKRSATVENHVQDPITEYNMRRARASELARRNMQTKPLHQTSYPLELDTFDTTDYTEQEIKRGNIVNKPALSNTRPPQRAPPPPPIPSQFAATHPSGIGQQSTRSRQALANCSNTPPVVRRVYKKAEAFIV